MLNLFAATGHLNYAKNVRMYFQIVLELSSEYPDLYRKFSTEGYQTGRRNNRFWGSVWTNLMTEQVMMQVDTR